VNFIYNAAPAPGVDPDALEAQASEILEIGWFDLDRMPDTIPDMSGELALRQARVGSEASVIITGDIEDESPLGES